MNSLDEFLAIVRNELGLPIAAEDAGRALDEVPGWDSVHLLWLVTILERTTGRQFSLPALLEATSLEGLYALAAEA